MKKVKEIIIHGFYGHGNLGDDLILLSIFSEINRIPGISIKVFCTNPKEINKLYSIEGINSAIVYFNVFQIVRQIKALLKCDLFILGGGGLLKDYGKSSKSLKKWFYWLRIAQILRKKTVLLAVGVENIRYSKSKEILKKYLKKVDLITVRDEDSENILRKLGINNNIKVISDPSILLTNQEINSKKELSKPPKIIISVRHWYDEGKYIKDLNLNENFLKVLSKVVDYLIEKYNAKIYFIPMRIIPYDDDRKVAKDIVLESKYKDFVTRYTSSLGVNELLDLLSDCDLVIGMRLHSLIIASSLGIPIIALEYMPKIKGFMKSIKQLEYCHDLNTISFENLRDSIESTFKHHNQRSNQIKLMVDELRTMTKRTIKLIALYSKI